MEKLSEMPNIGKELENKLITIGIRTPAQLKETGSCRAFQLIRAVDRTACINMLYALEGAVQNIRWHHLDRDTKVELKQFYGMLSMNE
jgi:DNA transformation protein